MPGGLLRLTGPACRAGCLLAWPACCSPVQWASVQLRMHAKANPRCECTWGGVRPRAHSTSGVLGAAAECVAHRPQPSAAMLLQRAAASLAASSWCQPAAAAAARAFAADALAVGSANPFLRFSSPVPKAIDHSPLLATLPETKVPGGPCCWAAAARSSSAQQQARRSSGPPCTMLLCLVPHAQVTTLPNGLRVATEHIPFAETATVGVWINSGSRFETDATNGAAHFLEHILFKGTKVRGGTGVAWAAGCCMVQEQAAGERWACCTTHAVHDYRHCLHRSAQ